MAKNAVGGFNFGANRKTRGSFTSKTGKTFSKSGKITGGGGKGGGGKGGGKGGGS
jgi:hypothetical protein